jgi:hypothetical protein
LSNKDEPYPSGFMNHDYVLTFSIANDEQREKLVALCRGPWQGDEVTAFTWEISNDLSPEEMELEIVSLLNQGDRAAYYYLSDSKRIFRVVLS